MPLAERRKHLLEYWAVLRRRRAVVALAVATVTATALVGSFLTEPLYRATVTLQVERQNPEILTFRDLATVDYSFAAYSDFYQTQYKILASDAVARRAVRRLGLADHPLFERDGSRTSLRAWLASLWPGPKREGEPSPEDIAVARLLASLEVDPVRNSQLVLVSWVSPDPELSSRVANAIADAYIQFNLEAHTSVSDQASEFLVGQVDALRKEIAALEATLQGYGEAKRIVTIDDANNITLKALSEIARRRTEAQAALAEKEATYRAVSNAPDEALPEVLRSDLIARLKHDYATLEAQYREKSGRFKEDWPELETLRAKLEQARARLEEETAEIARRVRLAAEADYRKALAEVRNLDALLAEQERAAQRLKRDAVEFANLQAEIQKKRETLSALMARQNEMVLATRLRDLDATSTNIRIVDPARPPTAPFRPKLKLNLLLGLLFGLGLGIAAAFFLDYLDNTIKSPAELEGIVGLPVLAVVPRHGATGSARPRIAWREAVPADSGADLVSHRERSAPASEAYRQLRTALLLSSPGHPPRTVLITSALPEEGKSATAVNLAIVLAQLGRRVLLVDTDLRRPRFERIFRVPSERGLSNWLSGLETDPASVVFPTDIAGLDVLPSGPIPPNPSELLNSREFAAAGPALAGLGYDHVVFDSPPLLSVADPVLIAAAAEATLVVVRAGTTPRESLRLGVEKLRQAGIRPIGIVFNDLDLRGVGYYGSYGYGPYRRRERDSEARKEAARAGIG